MTCHTLFCVAETHPDDVHVDVTGHTWHEPLSDEPVVARAHDVDTGTSYDLTDARYDEWRRQRDDDLELRLGETRQQARAAEDDR